MSEWKIQNKKHEILPAFSLTVNDAQPTAIYSDTELQGELVQILYTKEIPVFDREDGLYERLTVEQKIAFYHKWFNCQTPLYEILVMFHLHHCAKAALHKCTNSVVQRVYYAKYFMMNADKCVFLEPVHGVDIRTMNTFIEMLQAMKEKKTFVLLLVTNMEHAILLGDIAYKLQEHGLHAFETDAQDEEKIGNQPSVSPQVENLFKIPAKVGDKVILFDPPEIDYIESQDGKSLLVIDNESFTMDATLGEMEKQLQMYGFFRCHRSYIVNLQKVREIITWSKNTYSLRVDNKIQSTIPLSRTKIQDIQEIFNLK